MPGINLDYTWFMPAHFRSCDFILKQNRDWNAAHRFWIARVLNYHHITGTWRPHWAPATVALSVDGLVPVSPRALRPPLLPQRRSRCLRLASSGAVVRHGFDVAVAVTIVAVTVGISGVRVSVGICICIGVGVVAAADKCRDCRLQGDQGPWNAVFCFTSPAKQIGEW